MDFQAPLPTNTPQLVQSAPHNKLAEIDNLITHYTKLDRADTDSAVRQSCTLQLKYEPNNNLWIATPLDPWWADYKNTLDEDVNKVQMPSQVVTKACEEIIMELLKQFGVTDFLGSQWTAIDREHAIIVTPTFYHNRHSKPFLHKDGAGDCLFAILAYANQQTIPSAVWVPNHGLQWKSTADYRALPQEIKDAIETQRSTDTNVDLIEPPDLVPGSAICFWDELIFHATPPQGYSRYHLAMDDAEWSTWVKETIGIPSSKVQAQLDILRAMLKNVDERENIENLNVPHNIDMNLFLNLCIKLKKPNMAMLVKASVSYRDQLNQYNEYWVDYAPTSVPKLHFLKARRNSIADYKAGSPHQPKMASATLGQVNTASGQEPRRFMRLWVRIIPKNKPNGASNLIP